MVAVTAQDVIQADARIREYVRETPLDYSTMLSAATGCNVYLKLEHLQHTGSFKVRGALNRILALDAAQRHAGVIAASTGNHGRAVCHAARIGGIHATIYLPRIAARAALEVMRSLGGELVADFADPLTAELEARAAATRLGKVFISPYNDVGVIAGQGTVAVEICRQLKPLDAVFVATGGGGLMSGIGAYLETAAPQARVVGCWPAQAPALYESLRAGSIIDVAEAPTISTSTAGGVEPGSVTFDLCQQVLDEGVLVSEPEIHAAMRLIADAEGWIIEGAAGVAVAALIKARERYQGRNVAVILCGRNISMQRWHAAVQGAAASE